MPKGLAVAALAALAASAHAEAAVVLASGASTAVLGTTVPTTLAPGASATTVTGPNLTSATTTLRAIANVHAPSLLAAQSGVNGARTCTVELASIAGAAGVKKAEIRLGSTTEVVVSNGVVAQRQGPSVSLPAGGGLVIGGTFHLQPGATASLGLRVACGSGGATAAMTWTLVLTT